LLASIRPGRITFNVWDILTNYDLLHVLPSLFVNIVIMFNYLETQPRLEVVIVDRYYLSILIDICSLLFKL